MKKFLFSFILFLSYLSSQAQCTTGDITLNSQLDIDNFSINYPNCTDLPGDLTLTPYGIYNLNGLSGITSIQGNLNLENVRFTELTGLDNLTTIGGNLIITSLRLTSISALNSLTSVGGSLTISINGLEDLTGLENLNSIGSNLTISSVQNNLNALSGITNIPGDATFASISNFEGLENLQTINGNLKILNTGLENFQGLNGLQSIGGELHVESNPNLSSFEGFSALETIGGKFTVNALNTSLSTLNGLVSLTSVGGDLNVYGENIESFEGLENLELIDGDLLILRFYAVGRYGHTNTNGLNSLTTINGGIIAEDERLEDISLPKLSTLNGEFLIKDNVNLISINLPSIKTFGANFNVTDNRNLESISGFSELESIAGSFTIHGNGKLNFIAACNKLTSVGQDFIIDGLLELTQIDGFNTLTTIPGNFHLSDLYKVENITGFSNLETTGEFKILNSYYLNSIPSFNKLQTTTGDLEIYRCNTLLNIDGFNDLLTVNGNLKIESNRDVQTISGFASLDSTSNFNIYSNSNLTSISGFSSLKSINGGFQIGSHPKLESVPDFHLIETINGWLQFSYNPLVTSLNGFGLITSLEKLSFSNNTVLSALPNLSSLTTVDDSFWVAGNNSIQNLNGFSNLITVGGLFYMRGASALTDIEGLNNLQTIGGDFNVHGYMSSGFNALKSVQEDFQLTLNTDFDGFDVLDFIGGNISLSGSSFKSFQWPTNLTEANGYLAIYNTAFTDLPGIEVLESINGHLRIDRCSKLDNITINNVTSIGGYVELAQKGRISLNSLETVGGYLEVSGTEAINLPSLTTVGSNIELNLGNYYGIIGDLNMGSITSIGTDLDISGYFNLTSEWDNLTEISGNFEFHNGYSHENLNSFKNLEEITGDFSFRSDVQSFLGLNKLTSVGGTLTLARGLTPQNQDAPTFQNFVGLEGLEYVGGDLRIHSNKKLTDLKGLDNLTEINGALSIKSNEELIRIQALENLDATKITTVEISSNPKLSACAINSVCEFLPTLGSTYSHGNLISRNSTGCNSKEDVLNNCGKNTNILTGHVNLNSNNNNCSIPGTPIKGIRVNATNGTKVYSAFTNEEGIYNLAVPEGSYTINVETSEIINSVTPTNGSATLVGNGDASSSDFCISIGGNVTDAGVTIIQSTESIPNKYGFYYVVYENLGTTTINGTLDIHIDLESVQFSTFSDIDERILGTGYSNPHTYTILNLKPLEKRFIRLRPYSSENYLSIGSTISYSAEFSIDSTDEFPDNNNFELTQTATNFTPPYDELVLEGPQITLSQADEFLNYVVRFQNFEDSAVNDVLISTVLDDKLDWSTLEVLSSRHVQTTTVTNGNTVEFFFDNISLSAQKTNDYGSRGFLAYRIKPKQNVQVGDIITANSTIVFDGTINQQTNTVSTTIEMDIDSDGDGVVASEDPNDTDPCFPAQNETYMAYDALNPIWREADCDGDEILNGDELDAGTNPYYNEAFHADSFIPENIIEQRIEMSAGISKAIATNGTTVAVGRNDANSSKVELYTKSTDGIWEKTQELLSTKTIGTTKFGRALAMSENTLFISQPYDDENLPDTVFIYEKDSEGIWVETQQIEASSGFIYDGLGTAMSVSENTLVISADGIAPIGSVFVFEKNENNTWVETAELLPNNTLIDAGFGATVAVAKNQIVVGASGTSEIGAFIFEKQANGTWLEVQTLGLPDRTDNYFDGAVAIVQNRIIMGDVGDTFLEYFPGRTIVYERAFNGLWEEAHALAASNGYRYDFFGDELAMNNNRIVVNMSTDDIETGSLYVYHKSNGTWTETNILTDTEDPDFENYNFGNNIALDKGLITTTSKKHVHFFEDSFNDTDGDGVKDQQEIVDSTDSNDPCDFILANQDMNPSADWSSNDCDEDSISNGDELANGTNPLLIDTDGDGINDAIDTSPLDSCLPVQNAGYDKYDVTNELWANKDCDNDGISNADEDTNQTDPYQSDLDLALTVSFENVSCNGSSDASLTCQVIGGVAPYNFELYTNGTLLLGQTENVFDNLSSGLYQIKVTDANSNEISSNTIEVFEPEVLQASNQISYQNCLGIATIEVSGGTAPYEYQINGATFSASNVFDELATGNYIIGVRDANNCSTTHEITIDGLNDCSDFSLPVNNFTIETTGESCAFSNNGSILIRAEENLDYTAILTGNNQNESNSFRTFTNFQNLEAGSYEICITVTGEAEYEKCFSLQITEPDGLEVDSKIDDSGKTVSLSLKGSTTYFINVNGTEYSTSEDEITLPLSKVENNITVKTDKECQGVYEKMLFATYDSISIFPNPVESGDVNILLPSNTTDKEVLLTLFSQSGIRVLEKLENPEGRTLKLNMDGLPSGVYTVIITSGTQNSMRKIIKK